MQFGEGNFLRAFVEWILQDLNDKGAISADVVVVQPMPLGRVKDIAAQDGLYTLRLEGIDKGERVKKSEIIDVIGDCVNPFTDYEKFLRYGESEDLQIIISNTTEAGIALDTTDTDFTVCPKSFPGKLLALPFPAGKALDQLSQGVEVKPFRVKTQGLTFSLSGLENQVAAFYQRTNSPEETAAFAVSSVCDVVLRTTREAQKQYPGLEAVFSGGVASNVTLRRVCGFGVFAAPQFSTDNAMGVAVLAERLSQG